MFEFKIHPVKVVADYFKLQIFKFLFSKNFNVAAFLDDSLAKKILVTGNYEPEIGKLFEFLAKKVGYNKFLIDIGANIGVHSVSSSHLFEAIYCYEPNPIAFHVLQANILNSNLKEKVEAFNVGLGKTPGELELWVPIGNLGGAFVKSDENSYDKETLARKDDFRNFDERNYIRQIVSIEACSSHLATVFGKIRKSGLTSGIVKIDAEGMEEKIVSELIKVLPSDLSVAIVFENWVQDKLTNPVSFQSQYHDVEILELSENLNKIKNNFVRRFCRLFLGFVYSVKLCVTKEINAECVIVTLDSNQLTNND